MATNLQGLVEKYVAARDKKLKIATEAKERMAKIDVVLDKIEAVLLAAFDEAGVDSVKTAEGTAYKSSRSSYSVVDWESCFNFIKANEYFHMLERRVNKTAIDDYKKENGEIPPGLNARVEVTINVRRS